MATFVLVHGAGGDAWQWHRVTPLLTAAGHDVVVPELPVDDEDASMADYVRTVLDLVRGRPEVVLVGHSLGALLAPEVATVVDARGVVLVCPLVPLAGESPGQWWEATGYEAARRAADLRAGRDPDAPPDPVTTFLHDLPTDVLAEALAHGERPQSGTPFAVPHPAPAWPPGVDVRVVVGRDDRFLPLEFITRVARRRLGQDVRVDVLDCGHVPALAAPEALAAVLLESAPATARQ